MNIILHGPKKPKEEKELLKKVAEAHVRCISHFLENLDCSPEQKSQIIDCIKKHRKVPPVN